MRKRSATISVIPEAAAADNAADGDQDWLPDNDFGNISEEDLLKFSSLPRGYRSGMAGAGDLPRYHSVMVVEKEYSSLPCGYRAGLAGSAGDLDAFPSLEEELGRNKYSSLPRGYRSESLQVNLVDLNKNITADQEEESDLTEFPGCKLLLLQSRRMGLAAGSPAFEALQKSRKASLRR